MLQGDRMMDDMLNWTASNRTPVGVLSQLNIEQYDQTIADIKRRQAASAAKKEQFQKILREFEAATERFAPEVLKLIEIERERLMRRLRVVCRMIEDGLPLRSERPSQLTDYLRRSEAKTREMLAVAGRAKRKISSFKRKVDAKDAKAFLNALTRVEQLAQPLVEHYHYFNEQFKHCMNEQARVRDDGRIARAYKLYKNALEQNASVKLVGAIEPELTDAVPIYVLHVIVDERYLSDRAKIREDERKVHAFVEEQDSTLVGALVLHYEPVAGAA